MLSTITQSNACLPYNRVLALHELLEQVCLYLDDSHLKTTSHVCKHWNSLFAPFRWRKLVLWKAHPKQRILQLHGASVMELQLLHLDKSILKSIGRFCTSVHTLTICLTCTNTWITYTDLEDLFTHLRDTLIKCTIHIDVAYISPTILWSLCQLRRLKELYLDPYDSKDPMESAVWNTWKRNGEDCYSGLLICCPSLETMGFPGRNRHKNTFPSADGSKGLLTKWRMKRFVDGLGVLGPSHSPSTVQEAIIRRLGRNSKAVRDSEGSTTTNNLSSNVRRIYFKSYFLPTDVLHNIVSQCSFLEEIVLGCCDFFFSPQTWTILATNCSSLRVLRIQGCSGAPPEVPELILQFPRLEEIEIKLGQFEEDPNIFTTLSDAFMEHKELHGDIHPLKVLYISGKIKYPMRVLADLLALSVPTKIESLTIGGVGIPHKWGRNGTGSESERLSPAEQVRYSYMGPWPSLDRLKHLDISLIEQSDMNKLRKLYASFNDPTHSLRSLTVNITQLRGLISKDFYKLRLNKTDIPSGPDVETKLGVYRKMASGYCGFWFAAVEQLTIRAQSQWHQYVGNPDVDLLEAQLVISACPKVKWVDVRGVMGWWDARVLASEMRAVGCYVDVML